MSRALHVLVEELSAERALRKLLPRIVPGVVVEIYVFRGKPDLLRKLPGRLAGYAHWPGDHAPLVVVLVDRDTDDCVLLKHRVLDTARDAGLVVAGDERRFLARIAVEELEAWFFGDAPALRAAYPRLPAGLADQVAYRDPDGIAGGTAEALERLLQRHGYQTAGLSKTENAGMVASQMNIDHNSSRSFQVFRDGIRTLTATGGI